MSSSSQPTGSGFHEGAHTPNTPLPQSSGDRMRLSCLPCGESKRKCDRTHLVCIACESRDEECQWAEDRRKYSRAVQRATVSPKKRTDKRCIHCADLKKRCVFRKGSTCRRCELDGALCEEVPDVQPSSRTPCERTSPLNNEAVINEVVSPPLTSQRPPSMQGFTPASTSSTSSVVSPTATVTSSDVLEGYNPNPWTGPPLDLPDNLFRSPVLTHTELPVDDLDPFHQYPVDPRHVPHCQEDSAYSPAQYLDDRLAYGYPEPTYPHQFLDATHFAPFPGSEPSKSPPSTESAATSLSTSIDQFLPFLTPSAYDNTQSSSSLQSTMPLVSSSSLYPTQSSLSPSNNGTGPSSSPATNPSTSATFLATSGSLNSTPSFMSSGFSPSPSSSSESHSFAFPPSRLSSHETSRQYPSVYSSVLSTPAFQSPPQNTSYLGPSTLTPSNCVPSTRVPSNRIPSSRAPSTRFNPSLTTMAIEPTQPNSLPPSLAYPCVPSMTGFEGSSYPHSAPPRSRPQPSLDAYSFHPSMSSSTSLSYPSLATHPRVPTYPSSGILRSGPSSQSSSALRISHPLDYPTSGSISMPLSFPASSSPYVNVPATNHSPASLFDGRSATSLLVGDQPNIVFDGTTNQFDPDVSSLIDRWDQRSL